jgi:hypothetical protein
MVASIYWGDGTSDMLYIDYSGDVGSSQPTVASDPNPFNEERTKSIYFKDGSGSVLNTLTVTQAPRTGDYNDDYNLDY